MGKERKISLTPGFSRVRRMGRRTSRFNGFLGVDLAAAGKTVETVFLLRAQRAPG